MSTFETESVWFAQHRSRDINGSLWEPTYLSALLRILKDELWREFPHEAWGRPCRFDTLQSFLTSKDGLGWPDVTATCQMLQAVAQSPASATIRKSKHATLRDLAEQLLQMLAEADTTPAG